MSERKGIVDTVNPQCKISYIVSNDFIGRMVLITEDQCVLRNPIFKRMVLITKDLYLMGTWDAQMKGVLGSWARPSVRRR